MLPRLAFGLIAFVLVAPALAQSDGSAFPIHGTIDAPYVVTRDGYVPVPYTEGFHIDGWALDCRDGQSVPFFTILDHDMTRGTTEYMASYRVDRGLWRPDVQAAFVAQCPLASAAVGFTIYPLSPLAPGFHFLSVLWTSRDGYAQSRNVPVNVE